jgi:hypothetical protein
MQKQIIFIITILLCFLNIKADESILPGVAVFDKAGVAKTTGYPTIYINPAGLSVNKTSSIIISQARLYYDTYAYDIGFLYNPGITLAFGFYQKNKKNVAVKKILLNPDNTPQIDLITGSIKEEIIGFSDRIDSSGNIAFGISILNNISTGIAVRLKHIQHSSNYAWAFGVNAGINIKLMDIKIGLSIIDAGRTKYNWSDEREEYEPMQLNASIEYKLFDKLILILGAGEIFDKENKINWGLGTEIELFKIFLLRTGYSDSKFRIGFSFIINNLNIEYAFIGNSDFYDANRISIEYAVKN